MDFDLDNFDFKPITSGLGFHHETKTDSQEIPKVTSLRRERSVASPYQVAEPQADSFFPSDLESFYSSASKAPSVEKLAARVREVTPLKQASSSVRIAAYLLDLGLIFSSVMLTGLTMTRALGLSLSEVASRYPNEATPLILTLFVGYYLIYFSVFEKSETSTLGKSIFSLRVSALEEEKLTLTKLLLRSSLSLLNFVSLGLFSYYDLHSKVSRSRVVHC
jgi:uncharacterized RDD family membrane protein YckC